MSHRKLEFKSEPRGDRTWIYSVSGDLYGGKTGYALQEEVREKIGGGVKGVIVDLAGVERIDSGGIGILVAMMWSASRADGKFILVALTPKVRDILGIAMLLDHIDNADTIPDAMARLEADS